MKIKNLKLNKSHVTCHTSHVAKLSALRGGQLMIVTVLILGGAILSASVIAGYLMTRNIRQTTLANDSAKAIFAADAGLERILYECLKNGACEGGGACPISGNFNATLSNGTSYEAVFQKSLDLSGSGACRFDELRSVGFSDPTKRVSRALEIKFD